MSADAEPKTLTRAEQKKLVAEMDRWLKLSRESEQHQFGVTAAGVACGIKIATDLLKQ
jgi:hypothetical protein